jgi:AraC-like DNA-binding protein
MTEQNGSPELDGTVQGTHVAENQGEGPVAAQARVNDDLLVNDELALGFDDPDEDPEAQQTDTRLYIKVKNFNKFIDESLKGLDSAVALTWLVLFRFARDGVARVSKATIAERLGMSERHVARMIESLEGQNFIKVVKRAKYKQGSNVYQLGIRPLEKSQKPRRHRSGDGPESEGGGGLVESAERVQPVVTPSPESRLGDSAI